MGWVGLREWVYADLFTINIDVSSTILEFLSLEI